MSLLVQNPMDPKLNPYSPGAGAPPPEMAGRDSVLTDAEVAIVRTRDGRHAKGQLLLGLRGVGKTVLLSEIRETARRQNARVILVEAPEGRSLASLLAPLVRGLLLQLDRGEQVSHQVREALRTLRSFAGAFRLAIGDLEFGIDPEPGRADSGSLDMDLPDLFESVATAAQSRQTAVVLLIDEVQYLGERDLGALIAALHRVAQRSLPMVFFGAGLPQLAGLVGEAKSYAERMFDYPSIGPLNDDDARDALRAPALRHGADYETAALDLILDATRGYPYFLQEWGKHAWNVSAGPVVTESDAHVASERAVRELDGGFFRVRLDRLTPREKEYVRAMAELGPGPHRSGEIADALGMKVQAAGSLRGGLIRKGMIYSPAHGDTAFTVPMFDAFMRRTMPWPAEG